MLKAASEISYDHLSTSSSDRLASSQKRPRSHLLESDRGTSDVGKSRNLHETSFESYFGVERSASNSDVVRIRVPYSREDALQLKKATSQDENKIRISVNHDQKTRQNGENSENLEESFNTKLQLKKNNHYIKSNSKSMTNL